METDWENIVAMICLSFICWYAMKISVSHQEIPRVVDTIAGGFIGYLTRSAKQLAINRSAPLV